MPKDKRRFTLVVGDIHYNYVLSVYIDHFETYDQLFDYYISLLVFVEIWVLRYLEIDVSDKELALPFYKEIFVASHCVIMLIKFKNIEPKLIVISIGD